MRSLRLWGETHLVDPVFPVLGECVCSWNASSRCLCAEGVHTNPPFGDLAILSQQLDQVSSNFLAIAKRGSKRFQHLLKTSSLAHNEKDSREPLEMGKHLLLEVVTG